MKKIFILFVFIGLSLFYVRSQESANTLTVQDTRFVNDPPNFIEHKIRADLKLRSVIGIPESGYGYSTNLTIAPWNDETAGLNHQLSFNNYGIYYRNGDYSAPSWNKWHKLIISDLYGNIDNDLTIRGRLTIEANDVIVKPSPTNEALENLYSFAIQNYGVNKKMHGWNIMTASYTGAWEVGSNAFEIWEYPDRTSSEIGDATHRRFVIETGRDLYCNPVVIGPKGTLNIGYDRSFVASDKNDLSVNGNVGIGTLDTKGYKLAVDGTIKAKEIKVESGWADFVFDESYRLPSLEEVSSHIKEKKHLPGIPSAAEVAENGVDLGEMNAKLLQKIEELTLYVIKLQKDNEIMRKEIDELKLKY